MMALVSVSFAAKNGKTNVASLTERKTNMYAKIKDLPLSLQKALENLDYSKPDIEVKAAESYCLGGGASFVGNRGYVCAVNLDTGDFRSVVGSWGGSNPFQTTIDDDHTQRPIVANMAIIKGESGGRGHFARIMVAPGTFTKFLPAHSVELTDNQKIVLSCMKRLKSFARKEAAERVGTSKDDYEMALVQLAEMKLVKIAANGASQITTEGKNALSGVKMPDRARFL